VRKFIFQGNLLRLFMGIVAFGLLLISGQGANVQAKFRPILVQEPVTVWIQVFDSCQQAVGGEQLWVTGNGLDEMQLVPHTQRERTVDRVNGHCPLEYGNCLKMQDWGCTTIDLPVPVTGSLTYTIVEVRAAPEYVPCLKTKCPGGSEYATVVVDSTGSISARVTDKTVHKVFPTRGGAYSGTRIDPILLHSWDNREELPPKVF
jgi:hypothetical protein